MARNAGERPRAVRSGPSSCTAARPFSTQMPPGWEQFFSVEGMDRLHAVEDALAQGENAVHLGARLRSEGASGDEVAALLSQAALRRKAERKFGPQARTLLFTQAGLEQASRSQVAALHAARFRAAGCRTVADLGCGIGTESLALLAAGITVRAVEIDPFTARIAAANLATVSHSAGSGAPHSEVITAAAEDIPLTNIDGIFLDPARRTHGNRDTRRLTHPDDYSPSLNFAFGLATRFPTGIKLGPGFNRELIPADAEAQWVSVDGQVVETGLWFGPLARPHLTRSALVLRGGFAHELSHHGDAADVGARPLGEVIYEPDGAVIRARLIGALAADLQAGMLNDGIAYLTADQFIPTPFAHAFRILEVLPAGEKPLRKALVQRNIGTLEIKKRGANIDPAALRKRLRLSGSQSATLIMTRMAGNHVALLVERLPDPPVSTQTPT